MTAAASSEVNGRVVRASVLVLIAMLSGCIGLPDAGETETAIAARAEGLEPLSPSTGQDLKSVARNGLLRSPSVREAASKVSADADEVRVQRAALFPSLGIAVGAGVGNASSGDPAASLSGEQLIFNFGRTKRAVTAADLDLQISYIKFHQSVDEALVDIASAYDEVRMHAELLAVRRRQLSAMGELETLVAQRTESGAAASPDLLETRRRLQSAEFLLQDSELALAEARDRLIRLSGQPIGGSVSLAVGSCQEVGDTDDVTVAQLELAKAQVDLEQAEKARYPSVSVSPIARSELEDGSISVGLNLGVNSDFVQGGALTARFNAAQEALVGARAGVEDAKLESDLEARRLQREISADERRLSMLQRQIDLLAETRSLYRAQYFDLGTRQLTELLDNEEEYYNRQAELVETRSNLVSNQLDCAVQGDKLRQFLGLDESSIYDFPLGSNEI